MTDVSFQTKVKMQEDDFISLVNKIRSKIASSLERFQNVPLFSAVERT